MPRTIPTALATHLQGASATTCFLLKVTPVRSGVDAFGLTTLDADITYDDGQGPVTYRAAYGYTAFDVDTSADLSVDNSEASGLLAQYPLDGVTQAAIDAGNYDGARFAQYIINYADLSMGHCEINSGQVGKITSTNNIACTIELRSLSDVLRQNSMIELTSITDRAHYGDERNKMTLRWYSSSVASVGDEGDRTFVATATPGFTSAPSGSTTGTVTDVPLATGDGTSSTFQLLDTSGATVSSGFTVSSIESNGTTVASSAYAISTTGLVTFTPAPTNGAVLTWSGTLLVYPAGYFAPGVVHWLTGANAGQENEVESYDATTGTITLLIPALSTIAIADTFNIRRDTDGSKARAIADNNLPNMRAEPEMPRANGIDLQSPTPSS